MVFHPLGRLLLVVEHERVRGVLGRQRWHVHLAQALERFEPFAFGERVHHVLRMARRAIVQAEESDVVAEGRGLAHFERVRDELILRIFHRQAKHQVEHVIRRALAHVVKHVVRQELALAFAASEAFLVKLRELRLALLELSLVSVLEADACMHLVHLDSELIADALHGEVLPDRLHLLPQVDVLCLLALLSKGLDLPLDVLDRATEHVLRAHRPRVRRRREAQILLLKLLASARHRKVELDVALMLGRVESASASASPPIARRCALRQRHARHLEPAGTAHTLTLFLHVHP
mmetsp:Transcript_25370/g.59199  ORF Transcript_25370/g.59199 Transcript_25370/m.59199 type:complete len:292 (+) Transcript_25370:992-1867(+)